MWQISRIRKYITSENALKKCKRLLKRNMAVASSCTSKTQRAKLHNTYLKHVKVLHKLFYKRWHYSAKSQLTLQYTNNLQLILTHRKWLPCATHAGLQHHLFQKYTILLKYWLHRVIKGSVFPRDARFPSFVQFIQW